MCIWEVDSAKRHCEYCTYRGGCEKYPLEKKIRFRMGAAMYIEIMSEIIGADVLERTRRQIKVWARSLIAYQLRIDGETFMAIGEHLGITHATVIHGINQVEKMLTYPHMYSDLVELWAEFQKRLSLQKTM